MSRAGRSGPNWAKIKAVAFPVGTPDTHQHYSTHWQVVNFTQGACMHLGRWWRGWVHVGRGFTALIPNQLLTTWKPKQVSEPAPPTDPFLLDPYKNQLHIQFSFLHLWGSRCRKKFNRQTDVDSQNQNLLSQLPLTSTVHTCFGFKKVSDGLLFSELHVGNPRWRWRNYKFFKFWAALLLKEVWAVMRA